MWVCSEDRRLSVTGDKRRGLEYIFLANVIGERGSNAVYPVVMV